MRCARLQGRILLYLAGELEPREAARLRLHLECCSRCAAAAAQLAETQELVEGALQTTVRAPATLEARVMAAARREPARRRPWATAALPGSWRQWLAAVAAALSLLVGGFWAGLMHGQPSPVPGLAHLDRPALALARLGEDHLEYLANPQPAQVPGPDPREVSRRMTLLVKFPVAAVDLQPEGARLLGGRKCQLQGVWVAFLLYDWKGERVSLYQIDERKITLPALRSTTFRGRTFRVGGADGLTYVSWRSGVMNFVMVSGAAPERLLRLAGCASGMRDSA